MAYMVFRDSGGEYLVARIGAEADRLRWPSWRVTTDGRVFGENALGNWIRFIPSDWAEAEGSYPDAVQDLIGRTFESLVEEKRCTVESQEPSRLMTVAG
jgi:hypothetical protein